MGQGHTELGLETCVGMIRLPAVSFLRRDVNNDDANGNHAGTPRLQIVAARSFRPLQLQGNSDPRRTIFAKPRTLTGNPDRESGPQNGLVAVRACSHQPPRYLYCLAKIVRSSMAAGLVLNFRHPSYHRPNRRTSGQKSVIKQSLVPAFLRHR